MMRCQCGHTRRWHTPECHWSPVWWTRAIPFCLCLLFVACASAQPLILYCYPEPQSAARQGPPEGPPGKPDTTPPTVRITYPEDGSLVPTNAGIQVFATAEDNVGIVRLEMAVNGHNICVLNTDPVTSHSYSCPWAVGVRPNSRYQVSTRAYDAVGNNATATVIVTSAE